VVRIPVPSDADMVFVGLQELVPALDQPVM
jgi:hypothetical protein